MTCERGGGIEDRGYYFASSSISVKAYSKEAGLKFIDIVSTQTSTRSEPKLRALCETLLLLVLRSMTRHKDRHDAILTRRRGGSSTAQNRT